jgi:hypothetical protein
MKKSKMGLAGLVAAVLSAGGCRTAVVLNYEHNGARIPVPVYLSEQVAKEAPMHCVSDSFPAEGWKPKYPKKEWLSIIGGVAIAAGTMKYGSEEGWDDGASVAAGLGLGTLYSLTQWNRTWRYGWLAEAIPLYVGIAGLSYEKESQPAPVAPDYGGYDPNQGTDGGTGDDSDQDNFGPGSDGDQDNFNW